MSANSAEPGLPPRVVRLCSWLLLVFLLTPLFVYPQLDGRGGVTMLGMDLQSDEGASLSLMLILDLLLFMGGITALAILRRWRWAYDFGIAYAVVSLLVGALGIAGGLGGVRDDHFGAALQLTCLALFLRHLVRCRWRWRLQADDGHR